MGQNHDKRTARKLLDEWDRLEREQRWPDAERLNTAFRLAPNLETLCDLVAGRAVDPARLDQRELFIAKNRRLVRLDTRPIDLLEGQAA